jgi:predicted O-linked N-acetylglucosamine transferase (SPINDLY family)
VVQPDPVAPPLRPAELAELSELFRAGRHAELEAAAQRLLRLYPQQGFLWKALGVARAALGKQREALAAKTRAAQLLPQDAEARANLANALLAHRSYEPAEAHFRRAIALDPKMATAWGGLGAALGARGKYAEAVSCLRQVTELQPQSASAHNQLGNVLRDGARMPEARRCYEQALALRSDFPEALSNLGNTLADLGLPHEAERRYREALALQPDRAEIHSNLGNLLKDQGRLAEAQAAYRAAVEVDPAFIGAHSNLLLSMNHDPDLSPEAAMQEALRFGRFAAERAGRPLATARAARLQRPLRVGMVSGDLRNHPVGYFLEGLVAHLDPAEVCLLAYPTVPREDALTARIKPRFERWQPIADLDDAAAAWIIHGDSIDVLLDLAGHTAHSRLGVFAWRPAPVQATWLGYFATTGLAAMDWLIADRASVAPGDERHFTERIWYLPETRLCFQAPQQAPGVAPLPAPSRGRVTFGSFQSLGKINDRVLAAWAEVLHGVPGSQLRLQNAQIADPVVQDRLRGRLQSAGIDPQRVNMHGRSSRMAYLQAYGEVDIVLDTFPYPGGTTTCEALWMGVPTLTLDGDRMLSRQGASLLRAAGLAGWIAQDRAEYVRKAAAHACELHALAQLRAGLREQVRATPLFDAARFARHFTEAVLGMAQAPR